MVLIETFEIESSILLILLSTLARLQYNYKSKIKKRNFFPFLLLLCDIETNTKIRNGGIFTLEGPLPRDINRDKIWWFYWWLLKFGSRYHLTEMIINFARKKWDDYWRCVLNIRDNVAQRGLASQRTIYHAIRGYNK